MQSHSHKTKTSTSKASQSSRGQKVSSLLRLATFVNNLEISIFLLPFSPPFICKKMVNPREKDSQTYLEEHKILELFDGITAELVFNRPGRIDKK